MLRVSPETHAERSKWMQRAQRVHMLVPHPWIQLKLFYKWFDEWDLFVLSIHSIFFQSVFASILDSNLVMWTGIFFVVVCFARLDDCRRSVDEDKYFEIFIDCIPPMGPMQTRLCNSDDGDYSTLRAVLQ